ncbi:AA-permease domain-containing protein [Sulfidibacter corallicola]|uniref:Na-K-Cl cotransporter n=1 Tax=Sulfidibacter corallicola TaxID=2818388 RepID=A0A8A4TDF6_SULCO|nr:amino acid permease [Sulfidibacter corallicola]QTD48129.1 hypothetical protein J3U87_21295 [Sulfidibacter corallicola]
MNSTTGAMQRGDEAQPQHEAPKTDGRGTQTNIMMDPDPSGHKFGTFSGVFRPTILTILGVMMYLREGWVVGNAGLLGAAMVIIACYVITGATALSISSITTNMRVGSGGVFSIISQSLGLEVGGAVGVPLYLAQGLSAALYMQGIVETWMYMFPNHPQILVTLAIFAVCFGLSVTSTKLAFRVQVVVMVGVVAALASMIMGLKVHPVNPNPILIGDFPEGGFSVLFAVFFPASTGILVGSSLSGTLKNPRKSIPRGTLAAWFLSGSVYLGLAVWYALLGTPEQLRDTQTIFAVEAAFDGRIVLIGIISSCFSATLSSLVAAPQVLQALSSYRIVPFHQTFEKLHKNEPRNATLLTAGLAFVCLLAGDLNTLASILTMFFLVIYFTINLVLFIEQRLKMLSFRPTFSIPSFVPIFGATACLVAIMLISPLTGLVAIAFAVGIYAYLDHKQLETPWETVHSGIFASIANWAAKKVFHTRASYRRSWKPDLLVPVQRSTQLEGYYRIIYALTKPRGSIQVLGILGDQTRYRESQETELRSLVNDFQNEDLFSTCAVIDSNDFLGSLCACISVTRGAFFKPNTIFTSIENRTEEELQRIVDLARENEMGVMFLAFHPESGLGRERTVNLWVRDQSPDWHLGLKLSNLDYAVLMSYQLKVNWQAKARMLTVVKDPGHVEMADRFIRNLLEYARMPGDIEVLAKAGNFSDFLIEAPRADLNIMGLSDKVDKQAMENLVRATQGSCLFVLDSSYASALA